MWDPPERLIFFPRSSSSSTRLAVGRQRLAKGRWRGSSSDLGGVKGPHAMLSRLALPTQPSAREPSKIRGGDEHIEQLEPRGRAAERRHGPHARCTDLLRNDGSGVADAELDEVGEDIDARAEVFGVGEQPLEDKDHTIQATSAPVAETVCTVQMEPDADDNKQQPGGGGKATVASHPKSREWQLRKYLLLLAILVATVTYIAGLDPPGGVWLETTDEHLTGDPILPDTRRLRYDLFYYFNATAFVASLVLTILLLPFRVEGPRLMAVRGVMVVDLLCLMVAYIAGSCRGRLTTIFASVLSATIFVYIVEAVEDGKLRPQRAAQGLSPPGGTWEHAAEEGGAAAAAGGHHRAGDPVLQEGHYWRFVAFFVLNTVAFVASLTVIMLLLSTSMGNNGRRLSALNVAIAFALLGLMGAYASGSCRETETTVSLIGRRALEAAVILDLFGLIGAYSAGSCRDVRTSIYVFSLAVAIFVLVVAIYVVISKLPHDKKGKLEEKSKLEKKQKLLLLLAILAVTITYQAGLTPPGGFWIEHTDEDHRYGDSILADNYPLRYKAFFYCNATSFMASVIAIVCLMSRNLSSIAVGYCNALYACMAAGLVGLMGAYAARNHPKAADKQDEVTKNHDQATGSKGSTGKKCTNNHDEETTDEYKEKYKMRKYLTLLGILAASVTYQAGLVPPGSATGSKGSTGKKCTNNHDEETTDEYKEKYKMRKYLTLLGILAASVTYQAGLVPPGSVWPTNDGKGHAAGNPILGDTDGRRYHAFFYSNSTSFSASIVAIVLLLQGTLILPELNDPDRFGPMHMVVVLDLLGLLVAYAAGSSRDWGTSGYVVAMAVMVLAYVAIYVFLSLRDRKGSEGRATTEVRSSSSTSQSSRSTLEVARPASWSSGSADNV
ncbi:hypothetical protein OsJ_21049 [Oryza sativa Japonica Group]|uniref:PGG domain-containing protein n=1 Tax=Oryza sativa subsp. japonica TaxID=39947 RepID=B9FSU8_ORYSJ|nr:hypothetical protein OsJ_21049 [Oryza sativa Japonica Group]